MSPGNTGSVSFAANDGGSLALPVVAKSEAQEASPPGPGSTVFEKRILSLEDQLKGVTALLQEQQQESMEVHTLREQAHRMFTQLEESRRSRKAFEERARQLQGQMKRERSERDAWLESFTDELQKTLAELEASVDQSITDSAKSMQGRLEQADTVMGKLLQRVDEIFGPQRAAPAAAAAEAPVPQAGSLTSARTLPMQGGSGHASPKTEGRQTQIDELRLKSAAAVQSGQVSQAEAADILASWTQLLNENLLLQQTQSQLLQKKQQVASRAHSASTSPKPARSLSATRLGPRSLPHSCPRSPVCASPLTTGAHGTRPRLPIVQEQVQQG